jgi:hypothetical protein
LVCSCGDQGKSLLHIDPAADRPVTRAFQQLAKELVQQTTSLTIEKKHGLGSFELIWKEMTP